MCMSCSVLQFYPSSTYQGLVAMELNVTLFDSESSGSEMSNTKSDVEATTYPYLILFGFPLGVLLVVVPAMAVIIVILKNRKLREKNNNIFYVNLLVADVVCTLL